MADHDFTHEDRGQGWAPSGNRKAWVLTHQRQGGNREWIVDQIYLSRREAAEMRTVQNRDMPLVNGHKPYRIECVWFQW